MTLQSELDALERKLPRTDSSLDEVVRRYTTLSSALDALVNKRIVLRDPSHWDDTNDSYFLELYKLESSTPSVMAVCYTRATETYHHWRVFTPSAEGVCIEINRASLTRSLATRKNCAGSPVEYLLVRELAQFTPLDLPRLPFAKRVGYKDEREWRIIGLSDDPTKITMSIPFDPSWVRRIILNPWMPASLASNLRKMITAIDGCGDLTIEISHLTNSKRWKAAGKKICSKV